MNKTIADYILIVEDSPVDYEIVTRSLRKAGIALPIHHCESGDEALDFLLPQGIADQAIDHPTLILLDLNLPGTDGREVLARIKEDATTKAIPIVVLTTSNNQNDVKACYCHGANCYVKKPIKPDDYVEMAGALKDFWFNWTILPTEEC